MGKRIDELTAYTTPAIEDLFVMVDDPSGTHVTRKVTLGDVVEGMGWVDVRDYLPAGFVTDGSVDYSTETQAAITAAVGKPVLIPIDLLTSSGVTISTAGQKIISTGVWTTEAPIILNAQRVVVDFNKIIGQGGAFEIQKQYCAINGMEIDGLDSTDPGIYLNIDDDDVTGTRININRVLRFSVGIEFYKGSGSFIDIGEFNGCTKGLFFNPGAGGNCGENKIRFGNMGGEPEIGVHCSSGAGFMQGNFITGTIATCSVAGIQLDAGGNHSNTTFLGVSDQVGYAGVDLIDNGSYNLWIFYYIRTDSYTLSTTSTLISPMVGIKLGLLELYAAAIQVTSSQIPGAQFNLSSDHEYGSGIDLDATYSGGREYRIQSTADEAAEGAGKLVIRDNDANSSRFEIDNTGNVSVMINDLYMAGDGKGIVLTNTAGTVTKRVRLNDTGDGLIYEAP